MVSAIQIGCSTNETPSLSPLDIVDSPLQTILLSLAFKINLRPTKDKTCSPFLSFILYFGPLQSIMLNKDEASIF